MKQTIKYLAMLMVMLSFGLTSTSCGDDDDEVGNKENSALVGSWEWYDGSYSEIWTFNANGTCKRAFCRDGNPSAIDTGKYLYDSSTQILLISWASKPSTVKYKVLSISSLELSLKENFDFLYTLTRKI